MIAYETGAAQTVDPLAGSFYIESLTDEMERRAVAYLDRIDAMGGMLKAIERGFVQSEIQNAAYDFQRAVDSGEQIVVGVNEFQRENEPATPIQRMDEDLERRQVERLRALRLKRDAAKWAASLEGLKRRATDGGNLMPAILDAVESWATVGEIAGTLRGVFGEYRETVVV